LVEGKKNIIEKINDDIFNNFNFQNKPKLNQEKISLIMDLMNKIEKLNYYQQEKSEKFKKITLEENLIFFLLSRQENKEIIFNEIKNILFPEIENEILKSQKLIQNF